MIKTKEEYFRDWEATAFGYGYGSGEVHYIPAVKSFFELCKPQDYSSDTRAYDFRELESALTPTVAWLLINRLAQWDLDIIEYGTSPRFAWLTPHGLLLREFVSEHTAEELISFCTDYTCDYAPCAPACCNCGNQDEAESYGGHVEGQVCKNPFFKRKL